MKSGIQIMGAIVCCVLVFLLGRTSSSRNILTYSVNGYPTSFNRAWPTYGLPLKEDEAILVMLRQGHSKEAILFLDGLLDTVIRDAECRRPLMHGADLKILDSALIEVARYRDQFPRSIDTATNGFGNPAQLQQYEGWISEQKRIDAFLRSFVVTNALSKGVKND